MGLSAAARLLLMFSCWITATRLPGSGTCFSAQGLMSSILGRLGMLMPTKAFGAARQRQRAQKRDADRAEPSAVIARAAPHARSVRCGSLVYFLAGAGLRLVVPRGCLLSGRRGRCA